VLISGELLLIRVHLRESAVGFPITRDDGRSRR